MWIKYLTKLVKLVRTYVDKIVTVIMKTKKTGQLTMQIKKAQNKPT